MTKNSLGICGYDWNKVTFLVTPVEERASELMVLPWSLRLVELVKARRVVLFDGEKVRTINNLGEENGTNDISEVAQLKLTLCISSPPALPILSVVELNRLLVSAFHLCILYGEVS